MFCPTPVLTGVANNSLTENFSGMYSPQQTAAITSSPLASPIEYPFVNSAYKQIFEQTLLTAKLAELAKLQLGANVNCLRSRLEVTPGFETEEATDLRTRSGCDAAKVEPEGSIQGETARVYLNEILQQNSRLSSDREPVLKEEDLLDKFRGKDITVSRITKNEPGVLQSATTCDDGSNDAATVHDTVLELNSDVKSSTFSTTSLRVLPGTSQLTSPPQPLSPIDLPNPIPHLIPTRSSSEFPVPPVPALLVKALTISQNRKPRSQKKPIPDEQKNERYYERRTRNNLAAKKSRDQRKLRENLVTRRALLLETENKKLREEVAAYKQQALAMQNMLMHMGVKTEGAYESKAEPQRS